MDKNILEERAERTADIRGRLIEEGKTAHNRVLALALRAGLRNG
jgi:hypothetical protein